MDFRRRADYAPQDVYRHRDRGWEYIPVHPFADEPDVLDRLGLQAADCRLADAWWGIDGDATLLQSSGGPGPAELSVRPAAQYFGGVYLVARLDAPHVTRAAFEEAMVRFADAGFPRAVWLRLRAGDQPLIVDTR